MAKLHEQEGQEVVIPNHPENRICKQCSIEKKRRQMVRFGDFPEEDGYIWCSDKCLMLWIFYHKVTENGEQVTGFENEKGSYSVSELSPEDIDSKEYDRWNLTCIASNALN